ncbi:hypothetical protein LSUE1_G005532 [Lachnellula suecica]|uniref:DNA/RNA-binding protein Alba-like domain-containing protein n=1 Tax=Lachnellula suecica TaxID=602035 RepID=A0A8T9C4N9_9HELO|nr:hypothetical protein LSUE1_G005532 [Lachnellula suecica]
MARTKNRGRKGPEGHAARQAYKVQKQKDQEAGTSKSRTGKNKKGQQIQKAIDASESEPAQTATVDPDTASQPEGIDLPVRTSSNAMETPHVQPCGNLASTHDVQFMNIISSSQIEKKVTAALNHLSTYPAVPPAKPSVVMLHSKGKVASKLITVIEVAKREIAAGGGKWFQYNVIEAVLEEKKEEKVVGKDSKAGEGEGMDVERDEEVEEEEEGFETMKTPFERAIEGKPKVRAVPTMTTYLSRVRIDGLRKKYGEQTNGVEALD